MQEPVEQLGKRLPRRALLIGAGAVASVAGVTALSRGTADAATANNPVISGYYGDPWVVPSGNRYYLYPTTDGIKGWAATSFRAFSSADLVHWTDHGVVLDLANVRWGHAHAWAPSVVARNGRYYFYFVAEGNIGVATASSPTGPFTDALGRPLIANGQFHTYPIDPSAFIDDDGRAYLYFGNGTCYGVRLNTDMVSLAGSPVDLTQRGFREASNLVKRNGIYYLMWSENDTRSANYQVSYATGRSPLGPFTRAAGNPILKQNPALGIVATGSSSAFSVPGTDEWHIAYHRFNIPGGDGYHREVCVDRLYFNANGTIRPVVPTR